MRAVLFALLAVLAACARGTPPAEGETQVGLAALAASPGGWRLVSMDGRPPLEGTTITLETRTDEAGAPTLGGVACNAYGGRVREEGEEGRLVVEELMSTAMACVRPPGVMEQETAYLGRLREPFGARLERGSPEAGGLKAGRLVVEAASGGAAAGARPTLVFEPLPVSEGDPAALAGTVWRLESLHGRPPGARFTLAFPTAGTAVGRAGCRVYAARWTSRDGRMRFPATSMAGEPCDSLAGMEGDLTDALTWSGGYDIGGEAFTLRTSRGGALRFAPLRGVEPLEGAWALRAILSAAGDDAAEPVDPAAGLTLRLETSGDAHGHTGCNGLSGRWAAEGGRLRVTDLVATQMPCSGEGVMAREARYIEALRAASSAFRAGELLWLGTERGAGLLFERE